MQIANFYQTHVYIIILQLSELPVNQLSEGFNYVWITDIIQTNVVLQ